jgi:catechol-2,3-dioxygenase
LGIVELGHIGIFTEDLDRAGAFYQDVLGLTVTDSVPGSVLFLSSRPETEHHELVLQAGRATGPGTRLLHQISFRCESLEDIRSFHHSLRKANVTFDHEISHGNAVGIYFFDPDGNRIEVYWNTGLKARQPFGDVVDLEASADEIMAKVIERVDESGATGYVSPLLAHSDDGR